MVLLAVLVILVVLTLAAYRFNDLMTEEFHAADSGARVAQVQAAADSGLHYTAALLANPEAWTSFLNNNPYNNPSVFQGVRVQGGSHPRFRTRFSVIAPLDPDEQPSDTGSYRFGIADEAARINLNALLTVDPTGKMAHDVLMGLPYMTDDVASAIVDWIDPGNDPLPAGAEEEYYSGLAPPYHCKNGPLDSLEELLLVRGVTPDLLLGNDRNRNGLFDPEENDGSGNFFRGWAAYLTVSSRERNVDAQNNARIWVNTSNVKKLYDRLQSAVGDDLAYYIAAYRLYGPTNDAASQAAKNAAQQGSQPASTSQTQPAGNSQAAAPSNSSQQAPSNASTPSNNSGTLSNASTNTNQTTNATDQNMDREAAHHEKVPLDFSRKPTKSIDSLFELIGTQVDVPNRQGGTTRYVCPLNDSGTLRATLPSLLDRATTSYDTEIPARVNVNTAPPVVLTALFAAVPGTTPDDVRSILDHRPSRTTTDPPDAIFQTLTWLISEAGLKPAMVQKLEKYITARSQTYRVQVLGYFDQGGPRARVEAVIDLNGGRPRLAYWRDLTDLGPGFTLP